MSLTAPTSGLRHGDFLCRVEFPYESEGERGEASVWTLPDIPDDSPDHLQAIRSNGDTIVIYEEGRMLHYLMRGDTLYNKGEQSRRSYRILSQERPELVYPFQFGDSISGSYEGDCRYEGNHYTSCGQGYTVADGMGLLTDGEDTLHHVLRLHLHDYFEDDYGNETTERWSRDCFRWYCMGYRYPVMETIITYRHDGAEQEQSSSSTYLYLPVMQMELDEDVPNEELLARLEADVSSGQGRQGGVWQKASNGETLLTTSCYDAYGRLARQAAVSLNGNLVMSYFDYSFSGDLLDKRTFTYRSGAGGLLTRLSSEQMKNIYDFPHNKMLHQSVISIRGRDNTNCMRDTITFGYDEVGNLASMNRSGTSADMNYTYDLLHGWVKEISSTGGFQQKLYREDNANHPLYNGSISAMTWQVPGSRYMRRYDYTFDGMNRLTEGFYTQSPIAGSDSLIYHDPILGFPYLDLIPISGGGIGDPIGPIINAANRYTERISYDKNSNITSIERYGMNNQRQYGLIDSLVITRTGNQLKTIEDYAERRLTYTGASDFYDGYTYNNEYSYNANGSLESDINRDIDLIQYDEYEANLF